MKCTLYKSLTEDQASLFDVVDILQQIRNNNDSDIIKARELYESFINESDELEKKSIKKLYNSIKLKSNLVLFQLAITGSRKERDIFNEDLTGLVYLDIDSDEILAAGSTPDLLKKKIFFDFDDCVAAWMSYSGRGIACLFYCGVETKKMYSDAYDYVSMLLNKKYNINTDPQCKNVGRGNFLSYDPKILIKEEFFFCPHVDVSVDFKNALERWVAGKELSKKIISVDDVSKANKTLEDLYLYLKETGKNLTNGSYEAWRNMLFGLCDNFIDNEAAYIDWAHKLSELDYEHYEFRQCEKQANAIRRACLNNINKDNKITIANVFHLGKQVGFAPKKIISVSKETCGSEEEPPKKKKKENKGLAYDRLFNEFWKDYEFHYLYFRDSAFYKKNENDVLRELTDEFIHKMLKEAWTLLDRNDITKKELTYMIESEGVMRYHNELDEYFNNIKEVDYSAIENPESEFSKLVRCIKVKPGSGFTSKTDKTEGYYDETYVGYCILVYFTQCIRNSYLQAHNSHTGEGTAKKENEHYCAYTKKGDSILLLNSSQGIGKSTFFQTIAFGRDQSEKNSLFKSNCSFQNANDYKRAICHTFIILDDEGVSTKTKEVEELKANSSAVSFTYRKPYATKPTTEPAMANFIISTNHLESLMVDNSGLSRFLILDIDNIDWDLLNSIDIDKFWAEMLFMSKARDENGVYVKYRVERKDLADDYMSEYMSKDWLDDSINKYAKFDANNFMTINEVYIDLYYQYYFEIYKNKDVTKISIPELKKAQKDKLGRLIKQICPNGRLKRYVNSKCLYGYNIKIDKYND